MAETISTPQKVIGKVLELQKRLGKGIEMTYRGNADDLSKALGWYMVSRKMEGQQDQSGIRPDSKTEFREEAIQSYGYTFEKLDKEFGTFSDEELKSIKQKLFVF